MGWPQLISGVVLVTAVLGLALVYGWRQVVLLRSLRDPAEMPRDEARFQRALGWRRLVNSGLMLALAGLLGGAMLYLEKPAQQQADNSDARASDPENAPPLTDADRAFARIYGWYWLITLTVLMLIVFVAAYDLWATQRYARQQRQKLRDDQRAMIQRQVNRLREERNGEA